MVRASDLVRRTRWLTAIFGYLVRELDLSDPCSRLTKCLGLSRKPAVNRPIVDGPASTYYRLSLCAKPEMCVRQKTGNVSHQFLSALERK